MTCPVCGGRCRCARAGVLCCGCHKHKIRLELRPLWSEPYWEQFARPLVREILNPLDALLAEQRQLSLNW